MKILPGSWSHNVQTCERHVACWCRSALILKGGLVALRYGLLLKLKPVSRVTLSASRESLQAVVHRSLQVLKTPIWGFPKIRGTLLGVPIIRIVVYWGLYWGPPILGNYHIAPTQPLYDHYYWGNRRPRSDKGEICFKVSEGRRCCAVSALYAPLCSL